MKTVSEKLIELDNTEWYRELLTIDVMAKTETNCVHIDFINMMLQIALHEKMFFSTRPELQYTHSLSSTRTGGLEYLPVS
jgi:hypothetical protein